MPTVWRKILSRCASNMFFTVSSCPDSCLISIQFTEEMLYFTAIVLMTKMHYWQNREHDRECLLAILVSLLKMTVGSFVIQISDLMIPWILSRVTLAPPFPNPFSFYSSSYFDSTSQMFSQLNGYY